MPWINAWLKLCGPSGLRCGSMVLSQTDSMRLVSCVIGSRNMLVTFELMPAAATDISNSSFCTSEKSSACSSTAGCWVIGALTDKICPQLRE